VRGLDYYVRTTFEIQSSALGSAQSAVGGGGRYDGLVEQFGGPSVPGVGFALGVERTLLACDAEGVFAPPVDVPVAFVIDTTGGLPACTLTDDLHQAGIRAERAFDNRSMKAQMKLADRSGALVALIIGSDELEHGEVTVRDLRGDTGQHRVALADVIEHVKKRIS
jgi:histidyl-tRNA synthetase